METKEKAREKVLAEISGQLNRTFWDIEKRRLEIVRLVEEQQVAKRSRKLLTEAANFIKEAGIS